MTRIYVDTSIILSYCEWRYLDKEINDKLLEFFTRGLKGEFEFVISQLSLSELVNQLQRSTNLSMLKVISNELENSPDVSYIRLDSVTDTFFNEIINYSEYGLTPMDAMHIRVALDVGCNFFVTDDVDILEHSGTFKSEGIDDGLKIVSIKEILKHLNDQRLIPETQIQYGNAYEEFIIEYFKDLGFNTCETQNQDLGFDFLIEKKGKKFAVEAKMYLNSPVSASVIRYARTILQIKRKDIDGFWIVSTTGFSKEAKKISEKTPKIKLLNIKNPIKNSYPDYKESLKSYLEPFLDIKIEREIDFLKLKEIWSAVKTSKTNKEKKESLEDFAEFLFNSIDGVQVNGKDVRTSAEEIDLILINESNNQFWRQLGSPLLVECKNWNKKIGTDELSVFKDRLEAHNIQVGFLISIKGITGNIKKDAILKVREYNRKGFKIIVLDSEDLEGICSGENPTDKFREKYYEIFKF